MRRFYAAFSDEFEHFAEFGMRLHPPALACMTLGPSQEFGQAVSDFVREEFTEEEDLHQELARLQLDLDNWMLARLMSDAEGNDELGIYFRRPMSVQQAVRWLESRGVSEAEQTAVIHLGRLLGTTRAGIVALSLSPGRPIFHKVYLHVRGASRRVNDHLDMLSSVFEHFQIPSRYWRQLLTGFQTLGPSGPDDIFVSTTLGDSDAYQTIKLDMFQVNLLALEELLTRCDLLDTAQGSPAAVGKRLGLMTAEHCGLGFSREGCSLTTYFVRK